VKDVLGRDKPAELASVLIAQDRDLARQFHASLAQTRAFQILADLKKYPSEQMLEIRLRQIRPSVVLLDLASDAETACALVRHMTSRNPPVVVVGLGYGQRPDVVMRALSLGASEFLATPFEAAAQQDAVAAILRLRRPEPAEAEPGKVVALSSAKPGSGASVAACYLAFSLARLTRKRVLLADMDLGGGTVGFYTRASAGKSLLDVMEMAGRPEVDAWGSCCVHSRGVDILPAPPAPGELPDDPQRLRQCLDEARRSYDWTVLDLPSVFHHVSLLVLAEADRTYLATTSELPSLHLARKAIHELSRAGFGQDRFELLLCRTGRKEGISGPDVEKILGRSVLASLPDDHGSLHVAVALGELLRPEGALGGAIEQLAGRLAGVPEVERGRAELVLDHGPAYAEM
jgi:pilus assembly protein CpaE